MTFQCLYIFESLLYSKELYHNILHDTNIIQEIKTIQLLRITDWRHHKKNYTPMICFEKLHENVKISFNSVKKTIREHLMREIL